MTRFPRPALFALAAAAPLALLGLTAYGTAAGRLSEAARDANIERVTLTAALVESDLAVRLADVAGAAADPLLVSAAAARDAAAARRRLAVDRAGSHGVDRSYLVDPKGVLWADDPVAPESQGVDFSFRGWFKDLAVSSGPILSNVYVRQARPPVPVVSMAAPLLSNGRRVGILVHQYRVDRLAGSLGARAIGREGRLLVVDQAGTAVGRESADRSVAVAPPVRGALSGRTGAVDYAEPGTGRPMTAAYAPVRAGQGLWGVVVRLPADEFDEVLSGLRLRIGAATLLASAFAAWAAWLSGAAREREKALAAELEVRRGRLEAQARELARSNADLEQFAYLASHDLQAPLRSLKNYCDMFNERCGQGLTEEGRRLVGLTRDSIGRMQRMVGDLLDYSRLGRDREPKGSVSLDACLDEALANLDAEMARRAAGVERGPLPTVDGRQAQLTRLLQNLLANALKYCEGAPRIKVSAGRDGSDWTISVQDNGIGVPDEKREAVFGLFERLHPWERYEGSGIGLAACRKIVEHHGGRIWLEGAPGGGTVVKFTIPAGA